MDRAGGRPKALDIWEHVTELEGKRVQCKYCGFVFAASANRIKSHIYQAKGKGIRVCTRFAPPSSVGSNRTVIKDPEENLTDSKGLSTLDRARDYKKPSERMLDCYMSPKAMWEGIMAHPQPQLNTETQHQEERIQVGPFVVSNSLNDRDLQLIHYVFDISCRTCTIFSSSRFFLSQSEFATLKPETQLDSLVIDTFSEILTDIERKKRTLPLNWYLPVTFSNAALDRDVSYFLDFVKRQNMTRNYMSDLIDCKKMFIPVRVEKNSHEHFYLYIIHLKNQEVQIWNSLSNQFISEKEREVTTQKLLLALEELFVDGKRVTDLAFTNFYWTMAMNNLLQPNEYDCGIFVINYMLQSANYMRRNSLFQYYSDEERLNLALMLVKSDLNKERETLYEKAGERHNDQEVTEQDSNLYEIKRKCVDAGKTFSEDVQREAEYIELGDSETEESPLEKSCGACKLLRRLCTKDCIFAPYFPSNDPQRFAIVDKVYGASNVSKMLRDLPMSERADAVASLEYEANARVRDPVYGSVGYISILQHRIAMLQMELAATREEIISLSMQNEPVMLPSPEIDDSHHQNSHFFLHDPPQ